MFSDMPRPIVGDSGGEIDSVIITVGSTGGASAEHYGSFSMDATHPYSKIKVNSYTNIGSSHANYPRIDINDVQHVRPSVGSEFDIQGKSVYILTLTYNSTYTGVGITVELS